MGSPSIISHGYCLIHNLGGLENTREAAFHWLDRDKKGFQWEVISPVGVIIPGGDLCGSERYLVQRHQTQIQAEQEEVREG